MRLLVRLLLMLALLCVGLFGATVSAEDPACSGDFVGVFGGSAEYEAACASFKACQAADGSFVKCAPHFLAERLAVCTSMDAVCVAQARLQTALIGLYQGNGYQVQTQTQEFWTALTARLLDSEMVTAAADTGEAANWFKALAVDYGSHPMLSYIYGALAELGGDDAGAEANYLDALGQNTNDPLIYWTLGDFHAASGNAEQAAIDYALAEALVGAPETSAQLMAAFEVHTESYPLDLSAAEEHLLYPFRQYYGGPGGSGAVDRSLEAPVPVRILQYGARLLYIDDLSAQLEEDDNRVVLPIYELMLDEFGSYVWSGQDFYDGFWASLSLIQTEAEDAFRGNRSDTVFEGSSTLDFFVSEPSIPDPRPLGFRCEGAPQTRLQEAIFARPLTYFEPITLYDQPGSEVATEIEQVSQLIIGVDSGPECLDGFTWYQVTVIVDGVEQATGWIRENYDATHYRYDIMFYD